MGELHSTFDGLLELGSPEEVQDLTNEILGVVLGLRQAQAEAPESTRLPDLDVSSEIGTSILELLAHLNASYVLDSPETEALELETRVPVPVKLLTKVVLACVKLGVRVDILTDDDGNVFVRRVHAGVGDPEIDADLLGFIVRLDGVYSSTAGPIVHRQAIELNETDRQIRSMTRAATTAVRDSFDKTGVDVTMSTVAAMLIGATLQDALRRARDPEYASTKPEPEPDDALLLAASVMAHTLVGATGLVEVTEDPNEPDPTV